MASERDLFANFERMRREIDELFGDVFDRAPLGGRRQFSPHVDVYYCGQPPRAVVKVELAGIGVDDVSLEIHGRQLIIQGERRAQESGGRMYQQIEIPHGPFRRVVELGADVLPDDASATYDDGILRVEMPIADPEDTMQQVRIETREPDADD